MRRPRLCVCSLPAARASSARSVAVGLAAATPTGTIARARQPPPSRLRAEPARACARRASSSATATCACSTTCSSVGEVDAIVECSAEPSVLAGVDGSPDYVVQTNLVGAYNCLELARRAARSSSSCRRSRVYPVAALEALALHRDRHALRADRRAAVPGRSARRHRRGLSARGRAHALRRDQARRAELLIDEYRAALRAARRDRPLRRDRRPVADGQGRPGRLHLLDARPPLPAPARATSASAAAASRCATCSTSRICSSCSTSSSQRSGALGRARRSTSAAGASVQPVAARDDARCAPRSRAATLDDRLRRRDPPGRRPDLHLRLHAPVRADRLAARRTARGDPGRHSRLDRRSTKPRLVAVSASSGWLTARADADRDRHRLGRADRLGVGPALRRRRATT